MQKQPKFPSNMIFVIKVQKHTQHYTDYSRRIPPATTYSIAIILTAVIILLYRRKTNILTQYTHHNVYRLCSHNASIIRIFNCYTLHFIILKY